MSPRRCATCEHYRGPGERCESPDTVTALRALRWPEGGEMCRWHEERKDEVQ